MNAQALLSCIATGDTLAPAVLADLLEERGITGTALEAARGATSKRGLYAALAILACQKDGMAVEALAILLSESGAHKKAAALRSGVGIVVRRVTTQDRRMKQLAKGNKRYTGYGPSRTVAFCGEHEIAQGSSLNPYITGDVAE